MSPHVAKLLWIPLALGALIVWSAGTRDHRLGTPLARASLPIVAGPAADTGDRVSLPDLRGKVVLLDFWASFCPPCRASVPVLNALAEELGPRGLVLYGVNAEALPPGQVAAVAARWGFAYPSLGDAEQALRLAYDIDAFPSLLLFDREGALRSVHVGLPDRSALASQITSLLD